MVISRVILGILILVIPIVPDTFANKYTLNSDNVRFYDDIRVYNKEVITLKDREVMLMWRQSIGKAVKLLPKEIIEYISYSDYGCLQANSEWKCKKYISFSFFIDSMSWITGHPGEINLRPDPTIIPDWMTWEPLPKNGYSEEERLFVALHELGHSYDLDKDVSPRINTTLESPPTFYGCIGGVREDFGDTFALYVMFPEQLKKFPGHYEMLKTIFGREYSDQYQMPNSIRSKLVDPEKGCGNHEPMSDYYVVYR